MNGLHAYLRDDYSSPLVLGELRGGTMREGTSSINTSLNSSSIIRNDLAYHQHRYKQLEQLL